MILDVRNSPAWSLRPTCKSSLARRNVVLPVVHWADTLHPVQWSECRIRDPTSGYSPPRVFPCRLDRSGGSSLTYLHLAMQHVYAGEPESMYVWYGRQFHGNADSTQPGRPYVTTALRITVGSQPPTPTISCLNGTSARRNGCLQGSATDPDGCCFERCHGRSSCITTVMSIRSSEGRVRKVVSWRKATERSEPTRTRSFSRRPTAAD
jgi:hypothetical protein